MKKQDLKYGNVVELRIGSTLLYHALCEEILLDLDGDCTIPLGDFDENLDSLYSSDYDIVQVYEDFTLTKVLWERKPILTEAEKAILRSLPKEYKYIARDKDGDLWVYTNPVEKDRTTWIIPSEYIDTIMSEITVFGHLFQFVKWSDEKPYLIKDLIKEQ